MFEHNEKLPGNVHTCKLLDGASLLKNHCKLSLHQQMT